MAPVSYQTPTDPVLAYQQAQARLNDIAAAQDQAAQQRQSSINKPPAISTPAQVIAADQTGHALMDSTTGVSAPVISSTPTYGAITPGAVASGPGGTVLGPTTAGAPYGTILDPVTGSPLGTMGPPASGEAASAAGGLPFAPAAATAVGTYLAGKSAYDALKGKPVSNSPAGIAGRVQLGVSTGGLSELARPFLGNIGGGKGKDQTGRDQIRGNLQSGGLLDDNYNITLADGSKFNIGQDGGAKLTNTDGSTRPVYNTDPGNPLATNAIAWANPLAEMLTGGDPKKRSDFAGYFANAALSNAKNENDVKANIQAFYQNSGLTKEGAQAQLQSLLSAGKIDQQTSDVYQASINQMNLPSEGGSQMDAATGKTVDFNGLLSNALNGINSQAQAAAKKQNIVNLKIQNANRTAPVPVNTGPVRTGVQNLDNILQGVLG